jgi:hypothetical protein
MEPYKHIRKLLNNITGKHDIIELQKTAILDTAYIHTSESTNVKLHNVRHGK